MYRLIQVGSSDWRSRVQLAKQAGSGIKVRPAWSGFIQLGLKNSNQFQADFN